MKTNHIYMYLFVQLEHFCFQPLKSQFAVFYVENVSSVSFSTICLFTVFKYSKLFCAEFMKPCSNTVLCLLALLACFVSGLFGETA